MKEQCNANFGGRIRVGVSSEHSFRVDPEIAAVVRSHRLKKAWCHTLDLFFFLCTALESIQKVRCLLAAADGKAIGIRNGIRAKSNSKSQEGRRRGIVEEPTHFNRRRLRRIFHRQQV